MRCILIFTLLLFPVSCLLAQTVPVADSVGTPRGRLFLLPVVYYTPETQLGFGVRTAYTFRDRPGSRPSNVPVSAIYTTRKQTILGLTPDLWLRENRHHLYGQIGYTNYPFKFYGVGNDNPERVEEPYTTRIFDFFAGYERRVAPAVYLGGRVEFRNEDIVETQPGGLLAAQTLRGSGGQTIYGAGPTLTYDSRDNVFFPRKGFYHQLWALAYGNTRSDGGPFRKLRLDLRGYLPVGRGTLAAQALLIGTFGDPTFQYLSLIGGEKIMRGYFEGRYRDRNLMVYQLEGRVPISNRFKAVVFGSAGRVWGEEKWSFTDFHAAAGAGLRYRLGTDHIHIRFDLAYGQALYPYFAFTEAF